MANETTGLLGRKIGMTQMFGPEDVIIPVTVVDVSGNAVIAVKAADGKDGYNAVQLGIGDKREKLVTKPEAGHFAKAGVRPKRHVRELRVSAADAGKYEVGQQVAIDSIFSEGDKVDVGGISKGRGFAGVMKRHNFRGFIRSHGTHEYFRHGGSIGTRLTPGHVLKGKRMPGHMGAAKVTVMNLQIVKVDTEKGLLFIKGGIPGRNGGFVTVRHAVKLINKK
jgi:large subunit ribosomal protein L3